MKRLSGIFPANKLFLAPMAGITDLPFRLIARHYGCQFAFSEMVNAAGLSRGMKRSERYLASHPNDKPLGVQIFGSEPTALAQAALIAERSGASLVDINCGCPARKVAKVGAGAALMQNPHLVGAIIRAVRAVISIPLSIKIRAGWDFPSINAVSVALIAQEAGADMVCVHPRVAKQGFTGAADWRLIREVKNALTIPVIGNGDVGCRDDVSRMFAETNCDGVMIGRGAWGAPWVFSEATGGAAPQGEQRAQTLIEHLALACEHYGEELGVKIFRVHLLAYVRDKRGSGDFRRRVSTMLDRENLVEEIKGFWDEE